YTTLFRSNTSKWLLRQLMKVTETGQNHTILSVTGTRFHAPEKKVRFRSGMDMDLPWLAGVSSTDNTGYDRSRNERTRHMANRPAYEAYLNDHYEQHLEELFELLRIPSISSLPEHKGDVQKAAEWVANQLR